MKSINQVRHFYVAKSLVEPVNISKNSAEGAIAVVKNDDTIVFKYVSPGGLVTSDVIKKDNILYANYTEASKMSLPVKEVTIELDGDAVIGQEYIVKVICKNYAGAGDDNITVKYGMAVAKTSTKNDLITALGKSLEKNLKDLVPLMVVDYTTAAGKLVIKETIQDWEAGVKPLTVAHFDVEIFPIVKEGVETTWAKTDDKGFLPVSYTNVEEIAGKKVSGMKVSDLEWFHTGARGDMYRGFGHPHGVKTKLLADPTADYAIIDIHYTYVGPNEGAQKSEKTISIAAIPTVAANIQAALTADPET